MVRLAQPRRKFVLKFVRASLLPICGYFGLGIILAYGFLHPMRLALRASPADNGFTFENIKFPSRGDDIALQGWYIPAKAPSRGTIIFCHGLGGDRASALDFADYLHDDHFNLVAFDFRAYGTSGGNMSTIGWLEVNDALGAVDYVKSRPDCKNLPIGMFGISMGAATTIQAAARDKDIRCVVADSSYATLDSAIRQRFRQFGWVSESIRYPVEIAGAWMMGKSPVEVSPLAEISRISPRPIFLIHGSDDRICSVDDSRQLIQAAGEPKSLMVVDGAGHIGSIIIEPKVYKSKVSAFFIDSMKK